MSFLSGNLSVLSGSREILYTTQHYHYYLYYFTIVGIYRNVGYMDAPLKIFTTSFSIAYTTCHLHGMKQTPRLP